MQPAGLVGCIKCGGSRHPFCHVRANPSLNIFLGSGTSSGNVPLMWPYCPIVWPPRHDNGLLGHEYYTWHRGLIQILIPHIKHYAPFFSIGHGGPYSKPCNWILEVPIVCHHTLALLIATCQPFNLLKLTSCFYQFLNTYSIYLNN